MRKTAIIVFSGILSFSGVSFGNQMCSDVFGNPAPLLSTSWEGLNQQEQFQQLLLMLGSSGAPQIRPKDIKEKGELLLGTLVADGKSLNFEYTQDTRVEPPVFRLSRVNVISRSGQAETLSKEPIDSQTALLRQIELKNPNLLMPGQELFFPVVIEGSVFKKLMNAVNWLENVTPAEMRQHAQSSVSRLKVKGHTRRMKAFVARDLSKQIFRNAIFGGVIYISGSMALAPSQVPGDGSQQPQDDVAQQSLSAVVDVINKTTQVSDREKVWLLAQFAQNKPAVRTPESLRFSQDEILLMPGDQDHQLWLMNKKTSRLFLATVSTRIARDGLKLETSALVEIPSSEMPASYALISSLMLREQKAKPSKPNSRAHKQTQRQVQRRSTAPANKSQKRD